MAWSSPITPVSGTVITAAWAQSSIVEPVNWLRTMTGGTDPPGSGYVALSVSTIATGWFDLTNALAGKVNDTGDVMTSDLQINRASSAAPTTGYMILGNNSTYYVGFDGAKHVVNTPRMDVLNDLYVYRSATAPNTGYVILGSSAAHFIGFDGTNIVADASRIHTDANFVPGAYVPSGLIAAFATAAAIAAGWTRYTAADGRILIGAGITFSQTFTENNNGGSSNWTPSSGITIGAVPVLADGQTVLVNNGATTTVATASHTHPAPTLGGLTTAWVPPARVVVHAQKT